MTRGGATLLETAHGIGDYVRVYCYLCRTRRVFLPADLKRLCGNVRVEEAVRRMRCEKCRRGDYLSGELWKPIGEEGKGITVRRLVAIKSVRKVVWRDERL